jgi:hypothetical protein
MEKFRLVEIGCRVSKPVVFFRLDIFQRYKIQIITSIHTHICMLLMSSGVKMTIL